MMQTLSTISKVGNILSTIGIRTFGSQTIFTTRISEAIKQLPRPGEVTFSRCMLVFLVHVHFINCTFLGQLTLKLEYFNTGETGRSIPVYDNAEQDEAERKSKF